MTKPIIVIWGIGPTYRSRIAYTINKAISMGYANMMDYIILTDHPDEFIQLVADTGKIRRVVNIHDARDISPWSRAVEPIPASLDELGYGREFLEQHHHTGGLSYGLRRYILPILADMGYTKFILCDADVDIRYDLISINDVLTPDDLILGKFTAEEFWSVFDTPPNTVKAIHTEVSHLVFNAEADTMSYYIPRVLPGHEGGKLPQHMAILLYLLYEELKLNKYPGQNKWVMSEGPLRYFHFESTDKVIQYFEAWDTATKILLTTKPYLFSTLSGPGYVLTDYYPVAAANITCDMDTCNFPLPYYMSNIYMADRYFLPKSEAQGETVEDFLKKNRDFLVETSRDLLDPKF